MAPGIKMSLFVGFFLPLTLWLGFWQLDRAAYKRELQGQYVERAGALPMSPDQAGLTPAQTHPSDDDSSYGSAYDFTRLRISGEFISHRQYLVDNQVLAGKVGYWVISVLRDDAQRGWLVNRGWVAAGTDRSLLPDPPLPVGRVTVIGLVWPFTGLLPLYGDSGLDSQDWPRRIQRLDVQALAMQKVTPGTELRLMPVELRLEPDSPAVLQAAPQNMLASDQRHSGYALTWFGLAFALVVCAIVFWRRRPEQDEQHE